MMKFCGLEVIELKDVKIYAHRCAPLDGKPENSLEAAELAIENGADGFECDVRLTKDGEPVVIHDTNLSRMTDGAVKKKIADLPYRKITRYNYDANLNISHLENFLALAEKFHKRIFIELKVSDHRLIEWLTKALSRRAVDAVVISFKESDLMEIKRRNLVIKTGLIVGSLKQVINFGELFSLKKLMRSYDYLFFGWDPEEPKTKWMFKLAVWYLYLRGFLPLPNLLKRMIFTGTVKNKKDLYYLWKWGFSNIFSDSIKALK